MHNLRGSCVVAFFPFCAHPSNLSSSLLTSCLLLTTQLHPSSYILSPHTPLHFSHLYRIVGNAKLTFEELTTVLCQIEACLNSRPLTPLPSEGGADVLTPGHFLISWPLEAIPDPASISEQPISVLRRWNLCQSLVRHFWHRWSLEYLITLQRLNKWHHPLRNFEVNDVVLLRDETLVPSRWPIARVVKTCPGKDGLVRVIHVKTSAGTYTRPANKVVLLLASNN